MSVDTKYLREIFTSPAFIRRKRPSPRERASGKVDFYPNRGYYHSAQRTGQIAVHRSDNGADFAINKAAIAALQDSIARGEVVRGYVILAEGEGDAWRFLHAETLNRVVDNLRGIAPKIGRDGRSDYWWIDENFMPVAGDTPF